MSFVCVKAGLQLILSYMAFEEHLKLRRGPVVVLAPQVEKH